MSRGREECRQRVSDGIAVVVVDGRFAAGRRAMAGKRDGPAMGRGSDASLRQLMVERAGRAANMSGVRLAAIVLLNHATMRCKRRAGVLRITFCRLRPGDLYAAVSGITVSDQAVASC